MSELTMSQFASKDDLYSAMKARIDELEAKLAIAVEAIEKSQLYLPKETEDGWVEDIELLGGEICGQFISKYANSVSVSKTLTESLTKIRKIG